MPLKGNAYRIKQFLSHPVGVSILAGYPLPLIKPTLCHTLASWGAIKITAATILFAISIPGALCVMVRKLGLLAIVSEFDS